MSNKNEAVAFKSKLETVNGGTMVLVEKPNGETLEVKVKELSVLRMGNLGRAAAQGELAEVVLYTGLKPEQVEELTDASQLELLTEGRRLNFPKLAEFYPRVQVLNDAITGKRNDGPSMEQIVTEVLKQST